LVDLYRFELFVDMSVTEAMADLSTRVRQDPSRATAGIPSKAAGHAIPHLAFALGLNVLRKAYGLPGPYPLTPPPYEQLHERREGAGMTRAQVAGVVGLSVADYTAIESGSRPPTHEEALAIQEGTSMPTGLWPY